MSLRFSLNFYAVSPGLVPGVHWTQAVRGSLSWIGQRSNFSRSRLMGPRHKAGENGLNLLVVMSS